MSIHVEDSSGPICRLCWQQAPNMIRCDRRLGHTGRHMWEPFNEIAGPAKHPDVLLPSTREMLDARKS